ncbi:peptidylprolyl isomerase [Pasteurella canis]|uniref:Chaperone SurA n=2 Tax=Pasteurella canis TaxID=753 RepID=A0A379EXT3_9PAST|nr:peptidylprolyl isomerase [Pasteurella canis]MXN88119.1 peptidylprolyl isomerase [Pasteurella canis]UDW83757.1 peptidylprolyl isomerase [Pasteurella canis]UEA16827.1 peptidylprolyl isomerase [Pasteurella canis]UEC23268.1 peptidylprolyl isomerase [Pasteurella canis]SUC11122.1 chaperone SurA [Pasteurella canis]
MKIINMKSIFLAVIGLFAVSTTQAAERIVATVNGIPVLESQVKKHMGKKGDRQTALDKAIDDILVQQAIDNSGIKINYAQVDQIIEGIAAQNGLTYGQLLDALDYQGISYNAYRQQIANQLLMGEVRNQAIGQSIDVTREQVEALSQQLLQQAKEKGTEKKVSAKQYEVRHILLKLNPLLSDTQAKAQLTQIRADILSGKTTFADAALKYSKDYLSGANGGNLGFAFPESYVGPFQKTILSSKKGIISAPFKTEFGWHILEVTDTRESDRTVDAYRQKAYEQLVNEQVKDVERDWVKALRKHADIRYLK